MPIDREYTESELKEQFRAMLARIDERTQYMHTDIKEVKKHNIKQNGRLRKLELAIAIIISSLAGAGILDATVFHTIIRG